MYEKTIEVDGNPVTIRELTVKDIRNWLLDVETQAKASDLPLFSVDRDLFAEFPLTDLPRFTDLSAEAIDAMRPSDLRQVVNAVKEFNPSFFEMRGRMDANAKVLIEYLAKPATTSSAMPASSSNTGTTSSGPTE